MKCLRVPIAAILLLLVSTTSCGGEGPNPRPDSKGPDATLGEPAAEQRESIHDRVVHIEPELITEVPSIPRLCDELSLDTQRVDVGGAELHVELEGEGTPLVLINGGPGGTHHGFHPWFARAAAYARVIYYDQRGCGLSDFAPGEEGYSVGQAVDDLDALRQALNIDKWVLLGYSYGGFVAQLYTVTHPEGVAGLVLLGASPAAGGETGSSRQNDFLSPEELERKDEIRRQLQSLSQERDLSTRDYTRLLVYNNFINGDWKRQNYYKPSTERMAQVALYEWDHDDDFNGTVGATMSGIDLAGAFDENPIPTLILEGRWDLTWGEVKPSLMQRLHPRGELVLFENAGHGIYDEETDRFFEVLGGFIRDLPEVSETAVAAWAETLPDWKAERAESPAYALSGTGWGWNSSRRLAEDYSRDWLEELDDTRSLLRIGFAHYDVEDYDEALFVFERMADLAAGAGDAGYAAVALIWQGHMLDLLGRREEAVTVYQRVVDMSVEGTYSHGQYGMRYSLSPYARERLTDPFERIDNRDPS